VSAVAAAPADGIDGLIASLGAAGLERGGFLGLALADGVGLGLAFVPSPTHAAVTHAIPTTDPASVVSALEDAFRPRWVWWSNATAASLTAAGLRVATCWDLSAVHRLLFGGWRADPARVVAALHDLPIESIPAMGQLNLLDSAGDDGSDFDDPLRPDGHLRPEWISGGWCADATRLARWASTAMVMLARQRQRLAASTHPVRHEATARSESAAELLCAELEADGLPLDVAVAERIIGVLIGPRTANEREAQANAAARDAAVLQHVPSSNDIDLRNPTHVRSLLNRVGVDVPDTRAWRLEPYRAAHPVVEALLTWRKAERVATTYGYAWLDAHVGRDGRLRGAWTGSDGAAGRMTAQAGLHNLPADMRDAVAAEPGFVFVRADLGQIEPRVLAAVSGDAQLAAATAADDLYAPVAERLGVERAVAKVAVLAAMYGQTSGTAGQALKGLETAYPVAMRFLEDADLSGRAGQDVRTFGGRLVRMWATPDDVDDERERRSIANARGRYARNAMVQGAAAELFKAWAVTVRARTAVHEARIVLCLHDELLVHAPVDAAPTVADLLDECLQEAAWRWARDRAVRFVADTTVIARWSDAKP
jgi:DNA polymerase-1